MSAVVIEETEQVDSESRGEEEASTILFADKLTPLPPSLAPQNKKESSWGAKAMSTENMPHS